MGIALSSLVVPHLGMAPPLEVAPPVEVLPAVISLGLKVTQAWEVGGSDRGYKILLVQVIQIQFFVVVRPALCGYITVVELVGSWVVVAYPSTSELS